MPKCPVVTCKRSKSPDKRMMLHRFPKKVSLQTKWVKSCGLVDSINVSTERICFQHFHRSDYFKPLVQKMLGYSPKSSQKLKVDAVPSLKVTSNDISSSMSSSKSSYASPSASSSKSYSTSSSHSSSIGRKRPSKNPQDAVGKRKSHKENKFKNTPQIASVPPILRPDAKPMFPKPSSRQYYGL